MLLSRLVMAIAVFVAIFPCCAMGQTQGSAEIYTNIKDVPSKVRWCLREAGDDAAHIISGRCDIYKKCLDEAGLDEKVDLQLDIDLPPIQIARVKACHQALYNGARTNPQIKGSKATQEWLEHHVHPGTEAKSFSVPDGFQQPR